MHSVYYIANEIKCSTRGTTLTQNFASSISIVFIFPFLLGLTMLPRETGNNANAKFGETNKEYYGIFDIY